MATQLRPRTVKLVNRILQPFVEEGVVFAAEKREIVSQLKHVSDKGELKPEIQARLVDQKEAAQMLGISHANFKKLEREGTLDIPRRMVGSAVRYRNTDVLDFILGESN